MTTPTAFPRRSRGHFVRQCRSPLAQALGAGLIIYIDFKIIKPTVQTTEYSTPLGTLNGPYPRLFGAGPEFVTVQGALTVRYLFEFGAKSNFQGQVWCATFAYPRWMPKESPK
jgi:hypothetical protein